MNGIGTTVFLWQLSTSIPSNKKEMNSFRAIFGEGDVPNVWHHDNGH
jgi:hypothetical protein